MGRDRKDAYEFALRALGHKERTESELRVWLAEREVAEAEIEEVIALLAEAGAIDDASFARRYAEDKRELVGWGPDRIRTVLQDGGWRPSTSTPRSPRTIRIASSSARWRCSPTGE